MSKNRLTSPLPTTWRSSSSPRPRQSAAVPLGAAVTRGQRIASSGAVGFCPTAHLHVEPRPVRVGAVAPFWRWVTVCVCVSFWGVAPSRLRLGADGPRVGFGLRDQ